MQDALLALYWDEEGASLVEYLLLAALIVVVAFVGLTFLGYRATDKMNGIKWRIGK